MSDASQVPDDAQAPLPERDGRLAYSPAELAAALGCSRVHIQNMIARGELRSIKLGRKRLIPVSVVADLLDAAEAS